MDLLRKQIKHEEPYRSAPSRSKKKKQNSENAENMTRSFTKSYCNTNKLIKTGKLHLTRITFIYTYVHNYYPYILSDHQIFPFREQQEYYIPGKHCLIEGCLCRLYNHIYHNIRFTLHSTIQV